MAELHLKHIYKVYPNGTKAVNDFNMDIEDKEFIVFVGPSGCGKSTTLRMIAGLEEISSGELYIGDDLVNDIQPKDRDIAMVFQNYALYPHMTVYKNMAFGLRLRKMSLEEIDKRVRDAAEILGISEYLDRKPAQMSGGQRQRVALGRAIVREPKVFLLDEPLSNLDAKLRTQMRSEISKLHQKLNTTFIYVTHDQVEAMTMGTRIVVMKDGFVQQIDTPINLYKYPCNKFVAGFIGSPQMNFYEGTMLLEEDKVTLCIDNIPNGLQAPLSLFAKADRDMLDGQKKLCFGIRSEFVSVDPEKYPYKTKCRISNIEELGTETLIYGDLNIDGEDSIAGSPTRIVIKALSGTQFEDGQVIDISLDLTQLNVFEKETERNIKPRFPQSAKVRGEVKGGVLALLGAKIQLPPALDLDDGVYTLDIPTGCVSEGGGIKMKTVSSEEAGGKTLNVFSSGNEYLFGYGSGFEEGKEASLGIDLKHVTFRSADGGIKEPIPEYSPLDARLVSVKEVKEDASGKKSRQIVFAFNVQDNFIPCPAEFANRMFGNDRKAVFKNELELRLPPDGLIAGGEGIPATVDSVLDYGDETFAVCTAGDKKAVVKVDKGFAAASTNLKIDIEKLSVTDKRRGIRLI